jgi:hypothetical protein
MAMIRAAVAYGQRPALFWQASSESWQSADRLAPDLREQERMVVDGHARGSALNTVRSWYAAPKAHARGLFGSNLFRFWHDPEVFGAAAIPSALRGTWPVVG